MKILTKKDRNHIKAGLQINIFDRNPKKTLFCVFIMFLCVCDLLCANFLIKETYFSSKIRTKHPFYHHGLRKNLSAREQWGDVNYTINTNNLGFKSRQISDVNYSPNSKRIIFIGDSFTEGVGLPYEKTFVGLIDEHFKNKIDVLNAGVVSYAPKLYFLKIKYLIETMKLSFDELYVFIDISDIREELIYENFLPRQKLNILEQLISVIKPYVLRNSFIANKIPKLFATHKGENAFITFLVERYEWVVSEQMFREWGSRGLELAKENMEELIHLCKKNKIDVTIAVYPSTNLISKSTLSDRHSLFWKDFADKHSVAFLDLYPLFINPEFSNEQSPDIILKQYFIKKDVHWNKKGHTLVADKTIAFIEEKQLFDNHTPPALMVVPP